MRDFRIADRDQHLAELRGDDRAADQETDHQRDAAQGEQRCARALRLHVEAEDVLEVGQAVVTAKAEVVAEEGEQQRDRSSPG